MIRYVCRIDAPTRPEHVRYVYVVIDREREEQFEVGFELTRAQIRESVIDLRAHWARTAERNLWLGVKRESPGTYLDAVAVGWVPVDVTGRDW